MGLNFIGCLDDNEEEVEGSAVAVGGVVVEVLGTVMFLRRGSSNLAELDKVLGSVRIRQKLSSDSDKHVKAGFFTSRSPCCTKLTKDMLTFCLSLLVMLSLLLVISCT